MRSRKQTRRLNAKQVEAENENQLLLHCVYAASNWGDLVDLCFSDG